MITGAQVRAAKSLIRWSGSDLAEQAGVSLSSIRRIEAFNGVPDSASVKALQAIQKALELGGVEFIGPPEEGPGVRLKLKNSFLRNELSSFQIVNREAQQIASANVMYQAFAF